jgi:4-hydroxybutyrate dehydrogenase
MNPPTISYLSRIYFGAGRRSEIHDLLRHLSVNRPLIVTDPGLINIGLVDRLGLDSPCIFSDVQANPAEENVLAGLEAYRDADCDGLVAFGGGSSIDCAKGIAVMVNHPPPLHQYAFVNGGMPLITSERPTLIAIPTTAGTGSEVGRAALLTMQTGGKVALLSPHLIPDAVICDPDLTLDLPANLTAATGMDAVSHCVECFCSPRFNPVADAIALDGLKRAWHWLPIACSDGRNREARTEMLMAALEGGMSLQKGLGAAHSLSHALGGLKEKRLHHGTLNAVFMPYVLEFNKHACAEKMVTVADAIGAASAEALPEWFRNMNKLLDLPLSLSEMGVDAGDVDPLDELALRDHCNLTNPCEVTVEQYAALFKAAL